MSAFDPTRAAKEEISGLAEVVTILKQRQRVLDQKHGELEIELNVANKLLGFAQAELERKRDILKILEGQG